MSTSSVSWNGPICPICSRGYIGDHICSTDDLHDQVRRLNERIDQIEHHEATPELDPALICPCSGSGVSFVCGCTLRNVIVTC